MRQEKPSLLLLPGWNTPARYLEGTLPPWFLQHWTCRIHEWPGLGARSAWAPPGDMEELVGEVRSALAQGPFAGVVGFCLGGVVAWEHARRTPTGHPPLILVESPYHFPLPLVPILVPGIGPWLFRGFTGTRPGRACIKWALFGRQSALPPGFWEAFGRPQSASAAQAYLRIISRYEKGLPLTPAQLACPCHRIVGAASPRLLAWPWGRKHTIFAEEHRMRGVGHFPASECPEGLYRMIDAILGPPRIEFPRPRPSMARMGNWPISGPPEGPCSNPSPKSSPKR
ncbi:alpha/beta fold hydrolase [Holophaga foetida]|uniref:alpha/beta fold hydrolase n=1 Tax=Holophaga foetida TaxID=35839 RepID=UPI0002F4060E|nr:alpha/beta hydrolase [Holophaga foetida]